MPVCGPRDLDSTRTHSPAGAQPARRPLRNKLSHEMFLHFPQIEETEEDNKTAKKALEGEEFPEAASKALRGRGTTSP